MRILEVVVLNSIIINIADWGLFLAPMIVYYTLPPLQVYDAWYDWLAILRLVLVVKEPL